MANGVKDLRSLPLFEIIGAPLMAVVQAEVQATRATVDFIQTVGFTAPPGGGELDAGSLRMAEFRYTKADENRTPVEFKAQVPVLSLVPIPGIQVKNASIAFNAKITDVYTEKSESKQAPAGGAKSWLQPSVTHFRGSVASRPTGGGSTTTSGSYDLDIKIELERMPIAAGLEKILNMLDSAIRDEKKNNT